MSEEAKKEQAKSEDQSHSELQDEELEKAVVGGSLSGPTKFANLTLKRGVINAADSWEASTLTAEPGQETEE
jgi:hypothetical protein